MFPLALSDPVRGFFCLGCDLKGFSVGVSSFRSAFGSVTYTSVGMESPLRFYCLLLNFLLSFLLFLVAIFVHLICTFVCSVLSYCTLYVNLLICELNSLE